MGVILTERAVAEAKPRQQSYDIRCARLRGFLLRVEPSGTKTFYCQYARGKRYRLGPASVLKAARARREAQKVLAEAASGNDPMAGRRAARAHTLGSFIDQEFKPWAEANIRRPKRTLRALRSNFGELENRKLTELSPWLIEKWRSRRLREGIKATTLNRALDNLKSVTAKAKRWGFIDVDPLADVRRLKVDRSPNVRFLSADERKALFAALAAREEKIRVARDNGNKWRKARDRQLQPNLRARAFADHLTPIILLALNTGMRQGELFALRWADIDFENAVITIEGARAKSGVTRHLPLNKTTQHTLLQWHGQTSKKFEYVFPGRNGGVLNNVNKAWASVRAAAGLRNFRFHDLRHTFASTLVQEGVDLNTVRELLGHSSISMTLRYSHLAPSNRIDAVEKLEVLNG